MKGMRERGWGKTAFPIALVTALSLFLGAPALAQDDEEEESVFARQGGYVMAAVVGGFDAAAENDLVDLGFDDVNVAPGIGFNTRLGWRSTPHFGFEFELEYINDFTISFAENGVGVKTDSLALAMTFNGKVPILTGRIQPYGIAGAGLLYYKIREGSKNDGTSFLVRGGIGLDYYITENFVANIEGSYAYPTSRIDPLDQGLPVDADYVSLGVGLAYRF
ncbi:MAG: porin family protein [Deltaproteobacteria bacterium]|nr:porin family protein [Deltaproteobacteria bacterium]